MIPLIAVAALTAAGLLIAPAEAQTPFAGKGQPVPSSPPPKAQPAPANAAAKPQSAPRLPMSADMKQQAEFQSEGVFPDMTRPGAGGQVQDAWNDSEPRQGVYVQKLCEDCVYKIRTREFMTTTVILPEDAVIVRADPGDDRGFTFNIRAANKLSVRPSSWGQDTNVNVYTKSGAVYPFYIRSETVNSMNIPDLVVRIVGREKPDAVLTALIDDAEKTGPVKADAPAMAAMPGKKDFVRNVPLDPSKFHGWADYKLWGDEELKPETVWRDDFFTYIKYGKKWDPSELPAAWATVDGIDELVNSRVDGDTFIIESTNRLITLKNGKKYLCVQYAGVNP